jgi:hypothetical protein
VLPADGSAPAVEKELALRQTTVWFASVVIWRPSESVAEARSSYNVKRKDWSQIVLGFVSILLLASNIF